MGQFAVKKKPKQPNLTQLNLDETNIFFMAKCHTVKNSHTLYWLHQKIGIKHIMTTAYNLRANSKIEPFHKTLKMALRSGVPENWMYRFPMAMLSLRSLFNELINIVIGISSRIPGDILIKSFNDIIEQNAYAVELRKAMS